MAAATLPLYPPVEFREVEDGTLIEIVSWRTSEEACAIKGQGDDAKLHSDIVHLEFVLWLW